ncbi:DUF559 domain-containing protein [Subtercola boreus]|nr:DUF559 domain-containing protein [Subtercola boreus]
MPRSHPLPAVFALRPFSVRAAKASGVGKRRLDGGDLAAPYRGVRMRSAKIDSAVEQAAAYVPRLAADQFFSHTTAARLWRLPLPRRFSAGDTIHVATANRVNRVRATGVTSHRLSPPTHRVVRLGRARASDAVSTWLQLASILSVDDLVAVGDALVLAPVYPDTHAPAPRPYALPDELRSRVSAFRGPGKQKLVAALELVRLGCESPKETLLRLLIIRSGLPEPAINVLIYGTRSAFVPRVDLINLTWKVIIEYDGQQHREDSELYERDQQRAADLRAAGFTVVTVRKAGLTRAGRHRTVTEIRDALIAAGWQS